VYKITVSWCVSGGTEVLNFHSSSLHQHFLEWYPLRSVFVTVNLVRYQMQRNRWQQRKQQVTDMTIIRDYIL